MSDSPSDSLSAYRSDVATAGDMPDHRDVVRLDSRHDKHGVPVAHAVLTPTSDQRAKEIRCDPRRPIPVIFIPGVMGSLLVNKSTGAPLWNPPNLDAVGSGVAGAAAVVAGWFARASTREKRFDPTVAAVNPMGPIALDGCKLTEDEARARGWGQVHRWSYHSTLAWLETTLNEPMNCGELEGIWAHGDKKGEEAPLKPILGTPPTDYGAYGPGGPLTADSDIFKAFVGYRYPVYAIGYNFLQSNQASGKDVLDGVDIKHPNSQQVTHIKGIREICRENGTDKAIIITHSMGGLVARMACQYHGGAKDMLGVIHGAQPATGAPVFAKRFRTGGEGFINQSLLGRNDAEFVALAAFAEGPLELSPMPDYHDGEPWWIIADERGEVVLSLPKQSALDELYTTDAWYGILPNPAILDPAGTVAKRLKDTNNTSGVHSYFTDLMKEVVARQRRIHNQYHPNTYALYSDGAFKPLSANGIEPEANREHGLASEKLQTWGKVVWTGNFPSGTTEADLKAATVQHDNHHGVLKLIVRGQPVTLTVQRKAVAATEAKPDNGIESGDGTVPTRSARAQARGLVPGLGTVKADGVQMVFEQHGYEHQFCFNHPWARWATLYSVVQIAHRLRVKSA